MYFLKNFSQAIYVFLLLAWGLEIFPSYEGHSVFSLHEKVARQREGEPVTPQARISEDLPVTYPLPTNLVKMKVLHCRFILLSWPQAGVSPAG